jgi:DNA-binding response OmpR family regulator
LILEALKDKFSISGMQVLTEKNGEDGLKSALQNRPNLIILDIIMPKKDGLATLKELRQDNWGKSVPVIILTNLNENEKLAEAMEIGITEYLLKSDVKLDDVLNKAQKILD